MQEYNPKKTIEKNHFKITPDINTCGWKQNKFRCDEANKNICMFQGGSPQWLCSNDLPAEGELTVTIKVRKANMEQHDGIDFTCIIVGVMESNQKGEQIGKTGNHCVYLSLKSQMIRGPNESRQQQQVTPCSCQRVLNKLSCTVELSVNRNLSTIIWRYNGKEQAKSKMPQSWKDGVKLCAVINIWNKGDCVEFM